MEDNEVLRNMIKVKDKEIKMLRKVNVLFCRCLKFCGIDATRLLEIMGKEGL